MNPDSSETTGFLAKISKTLQHFKPAVWSREKALASSSEPHTKYVIPADINLDGIVSQVDQFKDFQNDISKWDISSVIPMEVQIEELMAQLKDDPVYAAAFYRAIGSSFANGKNSDLQSLSLVLEPLLKRSDIDPNKWEFDRDKTIAAAAQPSNFDADLSKWPLPASATIEAMKPLFVPTPFDVDTTQWDKSRVKDMPAQLVEPEPTNTSPPSPAP